MAHISGTVYIPFFLLLLAFLQGFQGVLIEPYDTPLKPCCYGDQTFDHGEVVLSLPRACLQLVCKDGKITRHYHGEPGDRECCEFDGKLYLPGEGLKSDCHSFYCRDSCWHASPYIEECCSRCVVYDDPHFTTFDGHHYDFHGYCNYSLAQFGFSHTPESGVYAEFRSCYGRGSCLYSVTFVNDPHTVITMYTGDLHSVSVNSQVNELAPLQVYKLHSSEGCVPVLAYLSPADSVDVKCLVIYGSSKIMLKLCKHRLDIGFDTSNDDDVYGLCGHVNNDRADDFTDRSGLVRPLDYNPYAFPLSWQTLEQSNPVCSAPCQDCYHDNTVSPCTATDEEFKAFLNTCRQELEPMILEYPYVDFHIESCAFDLCVITMSQRPEEIQTWLERVKEIVAAELEMRPKNNGLRHLTPPPTNPTPAAPDNGLIG